jgi:L-ascorbate metabolism protein UlaG (beta-lactamase superfamily)
MIIALLAILLFTGVIVFFFRYISLRFGGRVRGAHLHRIKASPNYRRGRFLQPVPTEIRVRDRKLFFRTIVEFMRNAPDRCPSTPIQTARFSTPLNQPPPSDLRVTWFGHSSTLIDIDGFTVLTDPVFGRRVSPTPFSGPKAFPYDPPFLVSQLPTVDVVLISHDHYDHLDFETIRYLKDSRSAFVTPLGVGAHLRRWRVAPERIRELDWGEQTLFDSLSIVAQPARHFSGRSGLDAMKTQFAAFVISGTRHRVFFSGDSGYFGGFEETGDRFGPFDITLLECGAYHRAWPDVHMMPEDTAKAHLALKGRLLVPIHWGKFNLSLHSWTDPVERLYAAADSLGIAVSTPRPGEYVTPNAYSQRRWWQE